MSDLPRLNEVLSALMAVADAIEDYARVAEHHARDYDEMSALSELTRAALEGAV